MTKTPTNRPPGGVQREERGTMAVYLLYEDDGPEGICGQSMDITSAWQKLIQVDSYDIARKFWRMDRIELCEALGHCGINGSRGRKNARIAGQFSDDKDDWEIGLSRIVKYKEVDDERAQ